MPQNNGVEYIVESGLEVGDVIIAEGAGLVREGAVIRTQESMNSGVEVEDENKTGGE